ncbi:hypothetical protein ABBQ32_009416 [Trebouxia sp. C0010 RCD-2024]
MGVQQPSQRHYHCHKEQPTPDMPKLHCVTINTKTGPAFAPIKHAATSKTLKLSDTEPAKASKTEQASGEACQFCNIQRSTRVWAHASNPDASISSEAEHLSCMRRDQHTFTYWMYCRSEQLYPGQLLLSGPADPQHDMTDC